MFIWKDGKTNPADILSKHWEFPQIWPLLKPLLFWTGETASTECPPVSHKEIRRILGWLLLPLWCLPKAPKSTLVWVHLTEIRWEYAQITQMYPVIHPPHLISTKIWGHHLNPIHQIMDCQTVLDHMGLKPICPTIPHN